MHTMGIPEKIKAIQDEMSKTQINKATEHHIGILKAKIAKLRREQEDEHTKKKGAKTDDRFEPLVWIFHHFENGLPAHF